MKSISIYRLRPHQKMRWAKQWKIVASIKRIGEFFKVTFSDRKTVQIKAMPLFHRGRRFHNHVVVAEPTVTGVKQRLEYLRGELREERISMGELCELQDLAEHIEPGDVELLEPAGVPEFPEEELSSPADKGTA